MDLFETINKIEEMVTDLIRDADRVNASRANLDHRCGMIYITEDWIAVVKSGFNYISYYGGFEYISEEYIQTLGDYTFFLRETERVDDAISYYFENKGEANEE